MSVRIRSRWQASGVHLLISVAIALAVLAVMLSVWYPTPLFVASGGNELLFILVSVDVVIGPLMTLVVFRRGKRGLKFDLATIATLQLAALFYGCHIVYLARPAFVVFVKDRFEVASAAELEPEELARASYPQFRRPPLTGPMLAAVVFPTDAAERMWLLDRTFAGYDMQNFPKYYVPYEERTREIVAKADPIARVRQVDPKVAKIIDEYLASSGTKESEVRYLALRARRAWVAVLIDAKTGEPVKMLIAEKI